jgi:hypothetical protein
LDDFEQFWGLFTWQQRFESLALGFESSRSPAKFAKRFESSNPDSWIRLTTTILLKIASFGSDLAAVGPQLHLDLRLSSRHRLLRSLRLVLMAFLL